MPDKTYRITVEKSYRLWASTLFIIWFGCPIGILVLLERKWDITSIPLEVLMLIMLIIACCLLHKVEPHFPNVQVLQADYYHDRVVLQKEKSSRTIFYEDISEVSKIMILNSKTYTDKGHYKVKIKNKGKTYVIYSTEDEYKKHLDFEQTELSTLYFEFKGRAVKCC